MPFNVSHLCLQDNGSEETLISNITTEQHPNHANGVNEEREVNLPNRQSPNSILPTYILSTNISKATTTAAAATAAAAAATASAAAEYSYISPQSDTGPATAENRVTPGSRHFNQSSFVTPENRHYAQSSFAKHASRVPLGNESADLEYMVSFLEQTVMQTLTK